MHSTAWRDAVRRSMLVIGLAGGFTVLGAGIAASTATADEQVPVVGVAAAGQTAADDENDETSGENGTGSGNQVEADVEAPVDATDNQVTVIGDGNESEGGGSEPENGVEPDADVDHTSGEGGTLSGNQVEAAVEAPVELSGNQVTVIGDGNTSEGSTAGSCQEEETSAGDTTNGDDGLLSGNQVDVDADAPVDASGNQVTVIGDENTSGGNRDGGCQTAGGSDGSDSDGGSTDGGAGGGDTTSGEDGTGSGNQLTLDPDVPVDVSGNQVTVIGDGNQSAGSTGGGSTGGGDAGDSDDGDTTSGEDGTGAGNQLTLDPVARLGADDNQLTVVGNGNENGGPGNGDDDGDGDDGTGGSGDPDDDGNGDAPGDGGPGGSSEPGDGRDGEVRGAGSGGPGRPGVMALGALPSDGAPATGVLPQTGAEHGPGLGLLALTLLLAGCALIVPASPGGRGVT